MESDALLAGHYQQWASSGLTGWFVGLGTGLEFVDRNSLDRADQYALAHFAGPSVALFREGGVVSWAIGSRLYGDFAPIRSLAWPAVVADDPSATYKSSLERGYQYNLGFSSRSYAELTFHGLVLNIEYTWGRYWSIEGLDRMQEQVTRDLEGSEHLDERRASVALEPPGSPVRAFVAVERSSHVSYLGGQTGGRLERRLLAGMGLSF